MLPRQELQSIVHGIINMKACIMAKGEEKISLRRKLRAWQSEL